MKDDNTPINPGQFLYGIKVVDIGDLRIARGNSKRPRSVCNHLNLTYDDRERRVWCQDCQSTVDPFDAMLVLVHYHNNAAKNIEVRQKRLSEYEKKYKINKTVDFRTKQNDQDH